MMNTARLASTLVGLALVATAFGCGAPAISSPATSTVAQPVAAADTANAAATTNAPDYSLDAAKGGKGAWAGKGGTHTRPAGAKPATPPTAAQIAAFKAKIAAFKAKGGTAPAKGSFKGHGKKKPAAST